MKKFIYIAILSLSSLTLSAQDNFLGITYNLGMPVGSTADFASRFSARGWGAEYRAIIDRQWGIGGSIGWNVFYEDRGVVTATFETVSVTGRQYKYVNTLPIMLTGHYHHKTGGAAVPFIGAGIGTAYIETRTEMGLYAVTDDSWHFVMAPEAGVVIPVSYDFALYFSLRYHYAPKTSKSISSHSWLGINLGLGWF